MTMENKNITIINNTGKDIRMFHAMFLEAAKTGKPLHEFIINIFTMRDIIRTDKEIRVVVEFA